MGNPSDSLPPDAPRLAIDLPLEALAAACRKWGVTELAVFGSILRDDFGPESDVDVLVTLAPGRRFGFIALDSFEEELRSLIGRPTHVITRRGAETRLRDGSGVARKILTEARPLLVAG